MSISRSCGKLTAASAGLSESADALSCDGTVPMPDLSLRALQILCRCFGPAVRRRFFATVPDSAVSSHVKAPDRKPGSHAGLPTGISIALILCCSGCATVTEKSVSTRFEIWDCRGEQPRRIAESDSPSLPPLFADDPLIPPFGAPKLPAGMSERPFDLPAGEK